MSDTTQLGQTQPDPSWPLDCGGMDVYLVALLQSGQLARSARVLDVGCGGGRNLEYFLRAGSEVHARDADLLAVEETRQLALRLQGEEASRRVFAGRLEELDGSPCAELVICNAVLHFAEDHEHFAAMLEGAWSCVAPGGILFVRLASSIGLAPAADLGGGRYLLRDGSERYLVGRAELQHWGQRLGGELLGPVKTTLVEDLRAMTTWVLGRPA